jgi:hypothetical protein
MSKGLSRDSHDQIGLRGLSEQHRIFAKVDELMALCDRLEANSPANKPNPAVSSKPPSTRPSTGTSDMALHYSGFLLSPINPLCRKT